MDVWILFVLGVFLTLGTGVFVAAEFSLVTLDRQELESRQEKGEAGLGGLIKGLKITSTHLSSAQLGITITTLLAGYTLEPALSMMIAAPLENLGVGPDLIRAGGAFFAVAVATLLSMIFGELVPKNFALARPLQTAKAVMPLQASFTAVMKPVVLFLNGTANGFLRKIGIEPKEELSGARTAQELSALVKHSADEGFLEADTATLLDKALRFSERTAGDVMTPRLKVISVKKSDSAEDILRMSRKSGFSKFPVIEEDQDDIIGVTHVKTAVAVPREKREEVPAGALYEDAPMVPETMQLDLLLATLRGDGFQIAIVVDEYGGTAGIVTLEDLVEELIGEVADEHDRELDGVKSGSEGISFPADLRPDEVLELTGIFIPEGSQYDTVAGYFLSVNGALPEAGDSIIVKETGGTLRVESIEGRRIDRLIYVPLPEPDEETIGGETLE